MMSNSLTKDNPNTKVFNAAINTIMNTDVSLVFNGIHVAPGMISNLSAMAMPNAMRITGQQYRTNVFNALMKALIVTSKNSFKDAGLNNDKEDTQEFKSTDQ